MSAPEDAGQFVPAPNPQPAPADPSAGAAPVPGQQDSGALEDVMAIRSILTGARIIAQKYPQTLAAVQQINDGVQKIQMMVMMVQPPAEVAAPPQ